MSGDASPIHRPTEVQAPIPTQTDDDTVAAIAIDDGIKSDESNKADYRTRSEEGSNVPENAADADSKPTDEMPAVDKSKTEEKLHHYLKRWQIWDQADFKWSPYDRTQITNASKDEYPDCYFFLNERFKHPHGSADLVMSNFSSVLTQFLRVHAGDVFFYDDPEPSVEYFFPKLKKMRTRFESAVAASRLDFEDREPRNTAVALGCLEASDLKFSSALVKQYVDDLVEQLPILLAFLEERFAPIATRLKLQAACGQLSYDLLRYHFEDGAELCTVDPLENPMAFVVSSGEYYGGLGPAFEIEGYGWEWNGQAYSQYTVKRTIPKFEGTKEVAELPCRGLTEDVRESLALRGRKYYVPHSGIHYRTYNGGRVMVDRRAFDQQTGYTLDPDVPIPELGEENLHLTPALVYGIALTTKEWRKFQVEALKPVVFDENAWDHLVLDPETKLLIKALVEVTKNKNTSKAIINDVISGKGGGLISVLHGPPGTGKTLTAEAVAEHLKRPLYVVGSAELSTQPEELELNLRGILSLATAWDAVLLIDEADVFLEQRSMHELQRNALVSVALRLLEYHRGVLFLTTNRIKTFDEAFLSRFSIAIKYQELDKSSRLTIWRKFFELAGKGGKAFSDEDLDELAEKPFNGRTIKNLVRTAQALALSSNQPISIEHVKIVVRVQEKFLKEFGQL